MARQILPIAGQIIGGMVGGPVGAAIGGAIGSVVGNAIDPQIIKGPKLGDGQVQTSAEGVYRPIVLGTGAVMGNIIHRGPEVVRTHRQRQSKGSGPKTEETRRYRTFAIRIAEGPIKSVLRIWMDEKLVYDIRPESQIIAESAEFGSRFRLYLGGEDQLPDPDIEAYLGIGNVNAYRGTAYVVFPNFDLTDYGDRIPQFRIEISSVVPYIIPPGFSDWKYLVVPRADATNRAGLDYDDSSWATGGTPFSNGPWSLPGEYGFPTTPATVVPETQRVWVRHRFNLPAIPAEIRFQAFIDNDCRFFVNGVLAATVGANNGAYYDVPIDPGLFVAGENLIAADGWDRHSGGPPVNWFWFDFRVVSGDETLPQTVGGVVAYLSERVGVSASAFDISYLDDGLDGIVFAGDYTAADCIRTLMPVYMFDASEHDHGSGYRINYVKRGGPVVATITAHDLVDEPEESVREDALERPQKLHMHFQAPTVGYAPAKATSMRNSPDVLVTGEVSVSVPVVFSDVDEAWQRAGVMHQVAWSEVAGTQELVLSDAWLELVPTDNIGLVLRDQQRRLRITKVEHVEGALKFEMMTDRQSSYTSNLTGVPLPDPTPPPPSIVGPTEFAFLDIPALTDSGDRLLYYVGVSGQTPAWYGAVIQRSMDGGANYEDVLTVRQNTIMGTLVDPVSDASEHYTDTTNVVRVELFTDDELQSLTQQQFLSEGGSFALEKPGGGWEIMQYRDAEQDSGGEWILTTLLRGRLNSGTDEHVSGARFVLLEGVYAIDAQTAMIGQILTHRAVSFGTSPELGPVSTDTYTAQSQTEWPVAHILSDGVDSGSLPVQIVPRHRFGTEDHPVRSINWQGYRLTATDGSNTATVDTLSDTHAFSVGGWSDPITVTASQLNRFTGAGPSASEEFE